ncbi:hypothetical protein EBZ37_12820, partial [bacterium]|nr:hypothetical protein [bacterium]
MASSLSLLQTSWKKIPQDVRRTIASLLGPPSWEEEVKKQIVCENSRVYFTPAGAQLMLRGAAFGSQVRLKNPDVDYFWSEQSHRGW